MVKATEVTTGLAERNGNLLLGIWRDSLHVTCGLTACTLGSAPTLGNEYGKTLPLNFFSGAKYAVSVYLAVSPPIGHTKVAAMNILNHCFVFNDCIFHPPNTTTCNINT